jgi:hypothetical protein
MTARINYKLSTGDITASNINLTGSIYQNGLPYSGSSLWDNSSDPNIFYTRGNIGIGTTMTNYRLTVLGPVNSVSNGPHAMYYGNTSTHPIFQQLNWDRDVISTNYDMYYDGTWRTSSTNSSYCLLKFGSRMYFHVFNGSAGSPISSIVTPTAMVLGSSGNIGIRTVNPVYPLHVSGYESIYTGNIYSSPTVGNIGRYYNTYSSYGPMDSTLEQLLTYISIYASEGVLGKTLYAFSDERIKKDITDIDDVSALETLRQIQPKRYKYIDTYKNGSKPVWGFIAQQVGSVLEYSTSKIREFIPNIYDLADVNGNTITLRTKNTSDLATNKRIKLYIVEDNKENSYEYTITQIVNDTMFVIDETLSCSQAFIYGIEVDDFHTLDKNAIFTVNVAATQELDRELQEAKQTIQKLVNYIKQKFPGDLDEFGL